VPVLEVDQARDLVGRLASAHVDSLGLNLVTIFDGGLWVAGVRPGSPAVQIGMVAEDIVRFEDLEQWENANRLSRL